MERKYQTVPEAIALMGYKARDKITGMEGIICSISFDLFGCVQAMIDSGLDKDGKAKERWWMDTSRMEILDKKRVMEPPDFLTPRTPPDNGPAAKDGVQRR